MKYQRAAKLCFWSDHVTAAGQERPDTYLQAHALKTEGFLKNSLKVPLISLTHG